MASATEPALRSRPSGSHPCRNRRVSFAAPKADILFLAEHYFAAVYDKAAALAVALAATAGLLDVEQGGEVVSGGKAPTAPVKASPEAVATLADGGAARPEAVASGPEAVHGPTAPVLSPPDAVKAPPEAVKTRPLDGRRYVEIPLAPDVDTAIAIHEVFTG